MNSTPNHGAIRETRSQKIQMITDAARRRQLFTVVSAPAPAVPAGELAARRFLARGVRYSALND